jgi:hypothetical protein
MKPLSTIEVPYFYRVIQCNPPLLHGSIQSSPLWTLIHPWSARFNYNQLLDHPFIPKVTSTNHWHSPMGGWEISKIIPITNYHDSNEPGWHPIPNLSDHLTYPNLRIIINIIINYINLGIMINIIINYINLGIIINIIINYIISYNTVLYIIV